MANRIHPTAVVGADVELGDDNVVGPYSVVVGPCRIGNGNWFAPHVVIGTPAEYRGRPHPAAWDGESDGAGVVIGDNNILREFVTVNQGTEETTRIGDDCYLLARSHVGHDCLVDDGVTLTDAVHLGGHTHVWSWANVGMGTVVHQRTQIGPGAMIGMGSAVRRTVEPFTIAVGNPARVTGVNRVGLSRRGCADDVIDQFESFLKGRAELPTGLPVEVVEQITAWTKVISAEKE
ncbi:UDP-N-acetylglucosamine acyltransferase [Micromonospora sp. KC207]|uniref:UDP-N-acetylglucosamine acyltransferase n=1 Tax=Micromonospora sp. KC207 TaxID=2530377 RepID=UPI00104E0789|nr:UDP-N-acetylglucosamine acyltransferase [Micromonospora sp. KC207]TDC64629.1 UDP-N-acetylglucosamine acyltransferase [Micromonospora sp. KC207]